MYSFVQDVPIDEEIYAEIKAGLGPEPPEGLVTHLVEKLDSGLRYVDVWESQEQCDRFTAERLHPVLGPILQRHNVQITAEPPRVPVQIIEVWDRALAAR